MDTQPPSLPYARDEASTSQPQSAYPVYPGEYDQAIYDEATDTVDEVPSTSQYFSAKRHRSTKQNPQRDGESQQWRLRSRSKTSHGVNIFCLNIGVDPPDIVKTNPCAKLECWVDPSQLPANKAIEAIGRNGQQQYETLNPKVRFKVSLDPSIEETKKLCVGIRKSAGTERVLFHYNGHGVPKPTAGGEIWVFNKNYTQYIPVSLYDLQEWLGSPCIYVWECSGAGNIITNFNKCAQRRDDEARQSSSHPNGDLPGSPYMDSIHLAACTASQVLPMSPELPADLFTCCLTSPIEIALRYFVLQDPLKRNISTEGKDPRSRITVDMVMRIPGDLKDRRTPLGELNWIFTAVTDTIAWLSFPRDTFNRLFRQDLLVAALFRNFLLANRIMMTYHCTPLSHPELPSTHNHPLWDSWDLAVDACLAQLPELLDHDPASSIPPPIYKASLFFAQHLQAFEVWLEHGGTVPGNLSLRTKPGPPKPPQQLPIVLQVLLSQAHRLRALILLSQFVDLGPWAVHLALSIGIFPYVQKLLQSPATELKPVLIFIWARIMAVDKSCQMDLLKEAGYRYFGQIIAPFPINGQPLIIPNANEHRAMCAFILAMFCRGFKAGQNACLVDGVLDSCLTRLQEDDWLLRTWSLLCIAQMWAENDEVKAICIRDKRQEYIVTALQSTAVEVRAAALYAFGTLLGASAGSIDSTELRGGGGTGAQLGMTEDEQLQLEAGLAFSSLMHVKEDASPMVRKELIVVLSCIVREWRGWMVSAAWVYYEEEIALSTTEKGGENGDLVSETLETWCSNEDRSMEQHQTNLTLLSSFKVVFEALLDLSVDPHTEVSVMASTVVDYIVALLLDSAFMRVKNSSVRQAIRPKLNRQFTEPSIARPTTPNGQPPLKRTETETSVASTMSGMKRSGSVATALRSLASMTGLFPSESPDLPAAPKETPKPLSEISTARYRSPYPESGHERVLPDQSQLSSQSQSLSTLISSQRRAGLGMTSRIEQSYIPVSAVSVLEALTEEDMERLRIRRLRGSQAGGETDGRMNNNGLPRASDLGLGMVAKEVKDDVLPLKSGFFDWAVEYFKEPQMKVPDADEPGSETYNKQKWRNRRAEILVEDNRANETFAATNPWNKDAGTLHNDAWPLQLAFHAYDPVLAVTDDADNVCIWDWKTKTKLNKFSNQNISGSSISSIHFINEMASSLILTASTEGSIRIFRDYETPGETALCSTFRAVSELHPVGQTSGVLTAWEQQKGHLLVGGDMRVVRLWDATVERHVRDIATQAGANLTAIASDEPEGNVFVGGFGDGVVRLFDKRIEDAGNVVLRTWRKHHTWIQSVHLQRGSQRELVTGSMNGEVRIWDVRAPDTPLYESVAQPTGLMALAVHTGAPIFATTSAPAGHSTRQKLSIKGFSNPENPVTLATIGIPINQQYHAYQRPVGFMPSATSLTFHPVEMVIAAGGFDASGNIRLFRCPTPDTSVVQEYTNGHSHIHHH